MTVKLLFDNVSLYLIERNLRRRPKLLKFGVFEQAMLLVIGICAALTIIGAVVVAVLYLRAKYRHDEEMEKWTRRIKLAAMAFLYAMWKKLSVTAAGTGFLILICVGWQAAVAFALGLLFSAFSGFYAMYLATRANVRTAAQASKSTIAGFKASYLPAASIAMLTLGTSILAITSILFLFSFTNGADTLLWIGILVGLSCGTSYMSLFAKVGGGIYTKTADIGGDLVGKSEAGLPEDSWLNAAVIADLAGDNVGDAQGMPMDIKDSHDGAVTSASVLGIVLAVTLGPAYIMLPITVAFVGMIASMIGILYTLTTAKEGRKPGRLMNNGTFITSGIFVILLVIAFFLLSKHYTDISIGRWIALYSATVIGLGSGIGVGIVTDIFTSPDQNKIGIPQRLLLMGRKGFPLNILGGDSYGLMSSAATAIVVGLSIFIVTVICWQHGLQFVLYAIALGAVGSLSISTDTITKDIFGPIGDNAQSLAKNSSLPPEEKKRALANCTIYDSDGNTSKAWTKGFSILGALWMAVSLAASVYSIFVEAGVTVDLSFLNPVNFAGFLVGSAMVSLFSAMLILAVISNTVPLISAVRTEYRAVIQKKKSEPDYARCATITTEGGLNGLVRPIVVSLSIVLIWGIIAGPEGWVSLLMGLIICTSVLAPSQTNSGGLWDNAKKMIEDMEPDRAEKPLLWKAWKILHDIFVGGDTVGDPKKDTSGPSLNTFNAVIAFIMSLFAIFLVRVRAYLATLPSWGYIIIIILGVAIITIIVIYFARKPRMEVTLEQLTDEIKLSVDEEKQNN